MVTTTKKRDHHSHRTGPARKSVMVAAVTHAKLQDLALGVGVNMTMSLAVDVLVAVTTQDKFRVALREFVDQLTGIGEVSKSGVNGQGAAARPGHAGDHPNAGQAPRSAQSQAPSSLPGSHQDEHRT